MGYQSRKIKYTSRREKYQRTTRIIRLIAVFAAIWAIVWVIKDRHSIWAWLQTYFY